MGEKPGIDARSGAIAGAASGKAGSWSAGDGTDGGGPGEDATGASAATTGGHSPSAVLAVLAPGAADGFSWTAAPASRSPAALSRAGGLSEVTTSAEATGLRGPAEAAGRSCQAPRYTTPPKHTALAAARISRGSRNLRHSRRATASPPPSASAFLAR